MLSVLTEEDVVILEEQKFICKSSFREKQDENDERVRRLHETFSKLKEYSIESIHYEKLFSQMSEQDYKLLSRFLRIKWEQVKTTLEETSIPVDERVEEFFLNGSSHRILFFIEFVHQYFFPV